MFAHSVPVSPSPPVSSYHPLRLPTPPISPAPPTPVPFAVSGAEGQVREQTARSPSVHPQSSTVSRPLPEAIRSSHKHTHIHSLLFYLLVTLSSLLLIPPSPPLSSSLPPFPLSPTLSAALHLNKRGFSPPHCFLPISFSPSLLPLPSFPPSSLFFEAMQYLCCGLLMLRQWTDITGVRR